MLKVTLRLMQNISLFNLQVVSLKLFLQPKVSLRITHGGISRKAVV